MEPWPENNEGNPSSVQVQIERSCRGKSYEGPVRAKWNDNEKRSFNGSWGKQPFGEKRSDNNFSSTKNFDKSKVSEIKKNRLFHLRIKHFKRDCPKNKRVDNKRLNVNKVSTEGTELEDGMVAARVALLGKVIPRRAIEDKLIPGISVEGASTIYLKGIFGPAVKCPLVYVPIGLDTGGQICWEEPRVENSLAQSSQDLRVDSGNVDETEVSSGILPEKAQENVEDGQRNITSCRNEVGIFGTKDEEVTAEMDKGSMVADSFRSERECFAELELAWKHAKEGKRNYYEVWVSIS
ncbi:CCHC-type domain-containing protein [Trichonephila inaurata madagascariensis]|uniref:CCHC-type domain-containing protein n=1 Tax=Trichonephila inaurata madagascariensis TaxID=2747483 RepID=A0A8X6WPG1_9ARAC|nr:CCHC-type domain-containing protein [Trichonephila inaurata madagascariensis]